MTQQLEEIKQGENYSVQAGDTRKSIAMRAYNIPGQWKWIEEANKKELESFHGRRLPPGMVLHIPPKGGPDGGNIH